MTPPLTRPLIAEFFGTFGLVFLGAGAATIDAHTDGSLGRVGVGVTFGLAVAAMILAFGRVSGAHINPAVTLGLTAAGHFPVRSLPPYVIAQLAGALLAAAALWGLFPSQPGHLGATLPAGDIWQSFGLEIVLTFVLMYGIFATAVQAGAPLPVIAATAGGIVGLEATFAGGISGASMNPARSFGPAVAVAAWDDLWIYWLAPALGALVAVPLHRLLRPTPASTVSVNHGSDHQC